MKKNVILGFIWFSFSIFVLLNCDGPGYRVSNELPPTSAELHIPKIMHHIWLAFKKDAKPSDQYERWAHEFQQLHPDWEYKRWTNETSRKFIAKHYPWFLETFVSYDQPMKRADSLRYFLLHYFGGVYADMGFKYVKNIEPLLLGQKLVAGEQCPYLKSLNMAFLASIPQHKVWELIFHELLERKDRFILEATGPAMFTETLIEYLSNNSQEHIRIYDRKFMYPFPWKGYEFPVSDELKSKENAFHKNPEQAKNLFPEAFLIKTWAASWL